MSSLSFLTARIERVKKTKENQIESLKNLEILLSDENLDGNHREGVVQSISFGKRMLFTCDDWIREDEESIKKLSLNLASNEIKDD